VLGLDAGSFLFGASLGVAGGALLGVLSVDQDGGLAPRAGATYLLSAGIATAFAIYDFYSWLRTPSQAVQWPIAVGLDAALLLLWLLDRSLRHRSPGSNRWVLRTAWILMAGSLALAAGVWAAGWFTG
jgi:hypothetical protein